MPPPGWWQPIDFTLIFSVDTFCDGVLNLKFISCEVRNFMIELGVMFLFFHSSFISLSPSLQTKPGHIEQGSGICQVTAEPQSPAL